MSNNAETVKTFDLLEWRERFIRIVLNIASLSGIVLIVASFQTTTLRDRILFIGLYLALITITLLPTPYALRAYFLLAISAAIGANAILAWGPWADGSIFLLASVFLASLLLDNRTDAVLLAASALFTILTAYLVQTGSLRLLAEGVPATTLPDWAVYIADFSIAGVVTVTAATMLKTAFARVVKQMSDANQSLSLERQNLEDKVRDRTAELETRMSQLRASTSTVRDIAEVREIASLLSKTADLISERFGYYHVGIYILDEQKRTAYLEAGSSETGRLLIGQAVRLDPDRKNPLAHVVENKKPLIAHDVDRINFVQDPNFPLTRSRMTIPLSVRGAMLGILDIHSNQPQSITMQDAEILQTLADLTAISFDNLRLINETRNLLSQLESSTALQTRRTWSKFTSRQKNAYLYTPAGVRPIFSQSHKTEDESGLQMPIVLHGEEIGKIRLKKRKGEATNWTEREQDFVEKIAGQVALALENNRLVDEAQKNALRNQMIASFSTQVRETLDVEAVVRTAASELRRVFDLKEAEILIGPGQAEPSLPPQGGGESFIESNE